jgi:hypothetical protein
MAAFESVFTQSGSDFFEIIPRVADGLSGFAEAKSGNTKTISSYAEVNSGFSEIESA